MNTPKIAIVSDPLVQRGGAERVVEELAQMFPAAPIYTLLYSPRSGPASLESRIVSSFLQRIPGAAQRHRLFVPLYAAAVERFDLSAYDVIISSHHSAAKGVLRHAGQEHICYCHTPMRALWERPHEELQTIPQFLRPLASAQMHRMRAWDRSCAVGVDRFIANSEVTRARIRAHYGRESTVVHPPIDTEKFTPSNACALGDYFLVASRNVPYKRIDIAVAAAKLARARLIVAGCASPAYDSPHVEQRGHVSDAELIDLMRGAKALIFPGLEDFGMTPVEMMACGRPVIAYAKGGALETVRHGETGVLVEHQHAQAFADAMLRFDSRAFDPRAIRRHAERFSRARFVEAIQEMVFGKQPLAVSS